MTDRLTEADRKHWPPAPQVTAWLTERIPAGARVLDVGAGIAPFARADVLVDLAKPNGAPHQEWIRSDIISDPLPFPDKSFEFVYCRHVLEDVHDPFPLLLEIERVGKAGYIETPSPIAELCRGVDGSSPAWRGYHHHHWLIWAHLGELRFVTKYPLVEHLDLGPVDLAARLRSGPTYWNTHLMWEGSIKSLHRRNVADFHVLPDYPHVVAQAIEQAIVSCDEFWAGIPKTVQVPQIGLAQSAA